MIFYSIIPTLCLCIGFYFGFKIGKTNKIPNINEIIKDNKEKAEEAREGETMSRILSNIDNYDGTPKGQEEIV